MIDSIIAIIFGVTMVIGYLIIVLTILISAWDYFHRK